MFLSCSINTANTGYTAGTDAVSAVANFVAKVREEKSDLIYLLDRALFGAYLCHLFNLSFFSRNG